MQKRKRKVSLFVLSVCLTMFFIIWQQVNYLLAAPRKESYLNPQYFGLSYETISFFIDDAKVSAWFVPGKEKTTIIFVPGWGSSKTDFLWEKDGFCPIKELHRQGFSLCFFDPRGLGESDGELFAFGYKEDEDIKVLIDFLLAQGWSEKFILFGFSAGANAAIRVALEKEEVVATIADGVFVSIFNTKIYSKPLLYFFYALSCLKLGPGWAEKIDLSKRNLESLRNIFLIAGEKDMVTPAEEAMFIFEKATDIKELWIVNCDHCEAFKIFPQEYFQRIIGFLNRVLFEDPLFW